jgi:L-seryl-tRNA(Ser) seleniumtransferase
MAPEVVEAMAAASRGSVDIGELQDAASGRIAEATGAEAGLVTTGAAAALTLAAAAAIARWDVAKMAALPHVASDILLPRTHRTGYAHALAASGARLVDIGHNDRGTGAGVRGLEAWEIEAALSPSVVAVGFSANANSIVDLPVAAAVCRAQGIPLIVDAAAQLPPKENLKRFIAMGADLVAFSGGKGIMGPQASGILAGRRELIESARLQMSPNHAIGRTCKVGKEEAIGLVTALELYAQRNHAVDMARWRRQAETIVEAVASVDGVRASVAEPQKSGTPAAVVEFEPSWRGPSASDVVARLKAGDPPIYVSAAAGAVRVNTHVLEPGDAELIGTRMRAALTAR